MNCTKFPQIDWPALVKLIPNNNTKHSIQIAEICNLGANNYPYNPEQ